ncbi:hypothetical protein Tco_1211366 [Tanacetum coccineum]
MCMFALTVTTAKLKNIKEAMTDSAWIEAMQEELLEFSWCGGPFNGGNCWHCTNVSFGDEFINNPKPVLNDETPDFSYPPSQPQTSSLDQWHCFHCKDPLERGERCKRCSCKWCGSGLNEGFCFICASSNENSSNNDLNSNSFNDPPNDFTYPPQPQYETYLCELCGNNSHYGYDCPPQFPFVYEQEPCYNQNYDDNYYSHNSSSFLCCNYGGPHESFQCQPMNQNHFEHNSNYSGFDQTPQFSVTHQLPRRSNKDMLLDMARLIKNNRTLFNSNIFPHEEMSIRVLLAKERILKLIQVWDEKQIKPWSLPELLLQLSNDSRTIAEILKQREEKRIEREQAANLAVQKEQEEQAAQSFTPYWNFPIIDDDDDEYTIQYREYLERSSKAITPDLPTEEPDNSLSFAIGERHLPIKSIIASRSTDMAATQTTNNNSIRSILKKEKLNGSKFLDWYHNLRIVLGNEQKLHHLEEALPEAPPATATAAVRNAYTCRVAEQ